jgi:hypothetical protein
VPVGYGTSIVTSSPLVLNASRCTGGLHKVICTPVLSALLYLLAWTTQAGLCSKEAPPVMGSYLVSNAPCPLPRWKVWRELSGVCPNRQQQCLPELPQHHDNAGYVERTHYSTAIGDCQRRLQQLRHRTRLRLQLWHQHRLPVLSRHLVFGVDTGALPSLLHRCAAYLMRPLPAQAIWPGLGHQMNGKCRVAAMIAA